MSWFEEGKVIVATTDGKTPTAGLEVAGENVVGTETLDRQGGLVGDGREVISPKSAEKSSKEDSAESGEVPSRVNPSEDSHEGDTRDAGSPDNDKTAEHRKDDTSAGRNDRESEELQPHFDYRSVYTPEQTSKMLYEGILPGYNESNAVRILGDPDEYHAAVLHSYIRNYDFLTLRIDACLRLVSERVHLVGEAQAVDRVIKVVADRYWSCNTAYHGLFISKDLVYCCLFSLILLNTDLNVLGVLKGGNFTKMRKSTYIKNTMDRLTVMYREFHVENNMEVNPNLQKQWKANFESLLSACYDEIKRDPFAVSPQTEKHSRNLQRNRSASQKEDESDRHPVDFMGGVSPPREFRLGAYQGRKSTPSQYLSGSGSLFSSSKLNESSSNFEIALAFYNNITLSGKYASVFQKTPELLHPNLGSLFSADSLLPDSNQLDEDSGKHQEPRARAFDVSVSISGRIAFRNIGKKDRDTVNPSKVNRFEYWAAVVHDSHSFLNLALWKFSAMSECKKLLSSHQRTRLFSRKDNNREFRSFFDNSDCAQTFDSGSTSTTYPNPLRRYPKSPHLKDVFSDGASIFSTGTHNIDKLSKLIFGAPTIYTLLHSVAHLLPRFNNADSEVYSMRLRLYNGNNCIISSSSKDFIIRLIDTVNVLASCKSREPMDSLEGNVNYGWDVIPKNRDSCAFCNINNDSNTSSTSLPDALKKRGSYDSLCIPGYNSDIAGYLSRISNSRAQAPNHVKVESAESSASDTHYSDGPSPKVGLKNPASPGVWNDSDGGSSVTMSSKHVSPLKKMFGKRRYVSSKSKIYVWDSIPPPIDRLSDNPPEKQLEKFKLRLLYVENSLHEHSALRAPMEEHYKNRSSAGDLALNNWIYKQHCLINEFEKYKVYVQTLTNILSGEGKSEETH